MWFRYVEEKQVALQKEAAAEKAGEVEAATRAAAEQARREVEKKAKQAKK